MRNKRRIFKAHEPTTGDAGRKAHQQASMVCSKIPNTRFSLNADRLADDPQMTQSIVHGLKNKLENK